MVVSEKEIEEEQKSLLRGAPRFSALVGEGGVVLTKRPGVASIDNFITFDWANHSIMGKVLY